MGLEELTMYMTSEIGWFNFVLVVGTIILVLVISHLTNRIRNLELYVEMLQNTTIDLLNERNTTRY